MRAKRYERPYAKAPSRRRSTGRTGSEPSRASTSLSEPKSYSGEIQLRIPNDLLDRVQKIALMAEMSVQSVIKVFLCAEILRSRQPETQSVSTEK